LVYGSGQEQRCILSALDLVKAPQDAGAKQ
jgi:hypothetical protein